MRFRSVFAQASMLGALATLPLAVLAAPTNGAIISGGGGANWYTCVAATICDGHINGNYVDSYDGTMTTFVNGVSHFNASITNFIDLTGQNVTGEVQTMSGLQVQERAYFDTLSATARMIASFTNAGASSITVALGSYTNMGSDGSGVTSATSSGNTVFDGSDRWMISQDTGTGDAVTAYVMQGLGNVAVDMTSVTGSAEVGAFIGEFSLTVGAGQTVSMMYFTQMYASVADAQAGMPRFDNLSVGDSLLAGLTGADLARIQNWNVSQNAVPEPGSLALAGLALAGALVTRRRKAA